MAGSSGYMEREPLTIPKFNNSEVRQLWFTCSGSLLFTDDTETQNNGPCHFTTAWLHELDRKPNPLIKHLQKIKSRRLGLRAESLWEFWLQNHPDVKLYGKNIQVYKGKETLGEFDFIYEDLRQGQLIHLETAVKYYLGIPQNNGYCWPGPNLGDQLQKKAFRLWNHQCKLSTTPEGQDTLRKLLNQSSLQSELSVKTVKRQWFVTGRLYYPFGAPQKPAHISFAHPNHYYGHWLTWSEWNQLRSSHDKFNIAKWIVPERNQWLDPTPEGCFLKSSELANTIEQDWKAISSPHQSRPFHCYNAARGDGEWYFIVPDQWVTKAMAVTPYIVKDSG